jgi:hypothetical protein
MTTPGGGVQCVFAGKFAGTAQVVLVLVPCAKVTWDAGFVLGVAELISISHEIQFHGL